MFFTEISFAMRNVNLGVQTFKHYITFLKSRPLTNEKGLLKIWSILLGIWSLYFSCFLAASNSIMASMLCMSWGGPWGRWGRNCTWILSGTENNTSYLSEVSPFHLLKTAVSPSPTCLQALWPTGRKQIHAVYGLDFRPALPSSPLCKLLWRPHLSLSQP